MIGPSRWRFNFALAVAAMVASQLLPRPLGLAVLAAIMVGVVVWLGARTLGWRRYRPPQGWTIETGGGGFQPPRLSAYDAPAAGARHVVRGTYRGWPLIAWQQDSSDARARWRCALDVGADLPHWFAEPVESMQDGPVTFPREYNYSPDLAPALKRVMQRDPKGLAWTTTGTWIVAREPGMTPWGFERWLDDEGLVLAELAAGLRAQAGSGRPPLAAADEAPALPAGGPARNVWTPEDVLADPAPVEQPAEVPWSQPDFAQPSREQDPR